MKELEDQLLRKINKFNYLRMKFQESKIEKPNIAVVRAYHKQQPLIIILNYLQITLIHSNQTCPITQRKLQNPDKVYHPIILPKII